MHFAKEMAGFFPFWNMVMALNQTLVDYLRSLLFSAQLWLESHINTACSWLQTSMPPRHMSKKNSFPEQRQMTYVDSTKFSSTTCGVYFAVIVTLQTWVPAKLSPLFTLHSWRQAHLAQCLYMCHSLCHVCFVLCYKHIKWHVPCATWLSKYQPLFTHTVNKVYIISITTTPKYINFYEGNNSQYVQMSHTANFWTPKVYLGGCVQLAKNYQ